MNRKKGMIKKISESTFISPICVSVFRHQGASLRKKKTRNDDSDSSSSSSSSDSNTYYEDDFSSSGDSSAEDGKTQKYPAVVLASSTLKAYLSSLVPICH